MKKLILLVLLLMLVACTTVESRSGIDTSLGAKVIGGKVIPNYKVDFNNSLEF